MSIVVRSSLDKPFGKLANDAILPFKVKSRIYSSVVNYVYSNLLPDSTFKEELAYTTLPQNVIKAFEEVRKHMQKATIQSAAKKAITEKIKQHFDFSNKLMNTKNLKILYYSENDFLGIGKKKTGENIYGQALEQARNELFVEQNKISLNDEIYFAYIAETNLKKALRKHNLEKYISKDKKRSVKKLVDALVGDYGKTEVYLNSPDLETILTLHEKRNIITYNDPNSLIRIVRKNEIRQVLKKNLFELKNLAVSAFANYVVSKNITVPEEKTTTKSQLFDILQSKREEFANRILDLYAAKALPSEIKDKIKQNKKMWYFPTEKDIEFFETENIKLPAINALSQVLPQKGNSQNKNDSYSVFVENDVLSPMNDSLNVIIDNKKFNSISHFIAYELNKLYGQINHNKLYVRIKDVKSRDLNQFNKLIEKDTLTTTKNKLLETAIVIKLQEYHIKNLIFSLDKLEFEDNYNLDKTEELYNKYIDKIVLKVQKIPSFEQFIEKDSFVKDVIKDKVDFYFFVMDNLMVHVKSKNKLNVDYNDLVRLSPFYKYRGVSKGLENSIPEYLVQKSKPYYLSHQALSVIWGVIYNSLQISETIVGKNSYDIRYKSLFIWAKYFLGQINNRNLKTMEVMQSKQEDTVLMVLMSILSKLKEFNTKLNLSIINEDDLQTAVHLCIGKVRNYKHHVSFDQLEIVPDEEMSPFYGGEEYDEDQQQQTELTSKDIDFSKVALTPKPSEDEEDEDEDYYYDNDYEDDDNFEGFNLLDRKKFEGFLITYFEPIKTNLNLSKIEGAVYNVLNSKTLLSLKMQNLNFFLNGFKLPQL